MPLQTPLNDYMLDFSKLKSILLTFILKIKTLASL